MSDLTGRGSAWTLPSVRASWHGNRRALEGSPAVSLHDELAAIPSPWALAGSAGGRYLAGLVALVAAYYAAAHLGYALSFAGPVAAIVWLPVGVAIASLYLAGLKFWPAVVAGDLLVNNYSTLPVGSALGQTCGNLLEVIVATMLLNRLVRDRCPQCTLRGVAGMTAALATGTAISATVGPASLLLGGVISTHVVPSVWRTWWLGDFSGALLVVSLACAWRTALRRGVRRLRLHEALLVIVALVGMSALASSGRPMLSYLEFPALIVCALRLRPEEATLAVWAAAALAVWETTHAIGPFYSHSLAGSVLETQLFIVVAAVTTLCLSAAIEERDGFARRLAASRARLLHTGDEERRRLAMNIHDGAQQRLAALAVRLNLAAEQARGAPEHAAGTLRAASLELGAAIDELRDLVRGRDPAVLVERGLAAAVQDVAERSAIPVVVAELPSQRLPQPIEATAYYVFAEAVANAQKHSSASTIRVRMKNTSAGLLVELEDNGRGGAREVGGSGLEGLRDRVEALGGSFYIRSGPGLGTRISATIPYSDDAAVASVT